MTRYKVFDVVELNNGDFATILSINKETYTADIVDKYGNSKGVIEITQKEIKNIIISK